MQIHVNRNGQQFGPYSPEEVHGFLQQGSLSGNDWAWHEGLDNWVQVSHLNLVGGGSEAIQHVSEVMPQTTEASHHIEAVTRGDDSSQADSTNSGVSAEAAMERLRRLQRGRTPAGKVNQRTGPHSAHAGLEMDGPELVQPVEVIAAPKLKKPKAILIVVAGVIVVGLVGYAAVSYYGSSEDTPPEEIVSEDVNNAAVSKLQNIGAHVTRDLNNQINGIQFPSINITTNGWQVLSKLSNVKKLEMVACGVGDAGAVNLRNLVHLKRLNLSENEITDQSVDVLKNLTQLQFLNLTKTKVTKSGVTTLQAALPDCVIER